MANSTGSSGGSRGGSRIKKSTKASRRRALEKEWKEAGVPF